MQHCRKCCASAQLFYMTFNIEKHNHIWHMDLHDPAHENVSDSVRAASGENCLQTCAKSAGSDHSAHAWSIIRTFALHPCIWWYPIILLADIEGPDKTAPMRTLIWAFAVTICPKARFCTARSIYKQQLFRKWAAISKHVHSQSRSLISIVIRRILDAKFLHVDYEDWSDSADAQSDLNLRWAHVSEGTFSNIAAIVAAVQGLCCPLKELNHVLLNKLRCHSHF